MKINKKTYGGLFIVLAYLILLRGGYNHWEGLLVALFFCVIGVLILKDKKQHWYENRWFKGYVSVQLLIILVNFYGVLIDVKINWFVPEDVLFWRFYHSDYTEMTSIFLYFLTWFVFTYCYLADKKQWFKRWHLSIWTLLILIGWNFAMLNHYQYVDESSIHSNGLFSSTTLSIDQVWNMKIDPKTEIIKGRRGRKTERFYYDIHFTSREGHSITFWDMNLTEVDIHAAIMIMDKLKDSEREIEAKVSRIILMSPEMKVILDKKINQLDDELAELFRDNFM